MSRVCRKKKEVEQFLIWEFVRDVLRYTISQPKWSESPDAVLTLGKGKVKKRVAIEHTGYFSDTLAGKSSPVMPLLRFWEAVRTSLCRRISHRKHLADVANGRVRFKATCKARGNDITLARQFALELCDFLETRPFSEYERFSAHSVHPPIALFSGFPTLKSMVSYMCIYRIRGGEFGPHCSWMCDNTTTGCIGLNLNYIKTAIGSKNSKAAKYNWHSAEERWLLITAAGSSVSEQAGFPNEKHWNDPDLHTLCCASPFHKIIFWARTDRWYKSLKPNHQIVEFGA